MRDWMSESTETHERPINVLDWPMLMPVLIGIFLTECVIGGWVWTVLPEWRWLVYLIIVIDLLTLVVIYIMITRVKTNNPAINNDSDPPDESQ